MVKHTIAFILLLLYSYKSYAQGEANNWYFGDHAGIAFNGNSFSTTLPNSQLYSLEGSSSISDSDGNLLFYSNGEVAWNQNHQVMQNGNNLNGQSFTTQSALIVPYPENENLYYLFTISSRFLNAPLSYNLIDMRLDNGLGGITSTKNRLLDSFPSEKIAAIQHANGRDIWIITHERGSNRYRSYLITPSGLNTSPIFSNVGSFFSGVGTTDSMGYMKASPNGEKIAVALSDKVELLDFDNETGILSSPIEISNIDNNSIAYGIAFSSNSNYLYATEINSTVGTSVLYQFDISSNNELVIINSRSEIDASSCATLIKAALQLAPDRNIYVAQSLRSRNSHDQLGVIENSNTTTPSYNCNVISFATGGSIEGLPNFYSDFFRDTFTVEGFCSDHPTNFTLLPAGPVDSIVWDFADGSTSTEENPMHTFSNAGTYPIQITITAGSAIVEHTMDVTIHQSPSNNIATDFVIPEIPFDGIANFDLSLKNTEILGNQSNTLFDISYHLTQNDAENNINPISSPYTNISNSQTIYSRIHNNLVPLCYDVKSFQLEVVEGSRIGVISDFIQCTSNSNGLDAFDLRTKDIEALNGHNSADHLVTYYATHNDAINGTNPLSSPFTNTSNPQTIYTRLEMIGAPTVFDTTSFDLITFLSPTFTTPNDIIVCDDNTNDGIESFDFTTTIRDILNGQDPNVFSVSLFASQNDLDNNTNPLPIIYQNTQPQQQIFAKIENTSNPNCVEQTSFMIGVSYSPFSVHPQDVIVCKNPLINNTVTIDLSDYVLEILGAQNPVDFTVTYHTNENDAHADQNPLPDTFSTTNNREQIIYRIENNLNTECYINATLTLIVNNSPTIGTLTDITLCDNNNDGIISFDLSSKNTEVLAGRDPSLFEVLYYATQNDLENNTNSLSLNYQNTQAQEQIFVRIHPINEINCFNQSSFNLTVSPTPRIASTPLALNNCGTAGIATFNLTENDDVILGNQSTTDVTITYHNSSNDAMNNINAITTSENYISQQDGEEIFIRIESNTNTTCFTTGSFILNVFEAPTAGTVTDLGLCGTGTVNYDLGFSLSEIIGTQDAALFDISFYTSQADADARTNELDLDQETSQTSTTIFARIENIGNSSCYQTTSFNILTKTPPILTITDTFFICAGETLTVTADNGYDSYEWSTGETTESIDITTPGEFSITVTEMHNTISCATTKTFVVQHSTTPQIIDIITTDFMADSRNSIEVVIQEYEAYEYSLDGITFQESNIFTNIPPGNYTIFVRNQGQCLTLSQEISISGYSSFFTPNGDGFNEYWQILNSNNDSENTVYIFDRYGRLLTHFTSKDTGWDGTYNGRQMPATDYWFKIEHKNGKTSTGHFSLKR